MPPHMGITADPCSPMPHNQLPCATLQRLERPPAPIATPTASIRGTPSPSLHGKNSSRAERPRRGQLRSISLLCYSRHVYCFASLHFHVPRQLCSHIYNTIHLDCLTVACSFSYPWSYPRTYMFVLCALCNTFRAYIIYSHSHIN